MILKKISILKKNKNFFIFEWMKDGEKLLYIEVYVCI